jgi:hypothetical protein
VEQSQVLFVTLNIPGGFQQRRRNWFGSRASQQQTGRNRAPDGCGFMRWLDAAFCSGAE